MSKTQAKKIAQRYAQALREADYPVEALYLFGSYVQGTANPDSDIDVAVVSRIFNKNRDHDRLFLWQARRAIDKRIEPHTFTPESFGNNEDPLAFEIRKTGIRIV